MLFNTDHELVPAGMAADASDHFDRVRERFMAVLERHLDDSTAKFNRWFFENSDGVIHQISKQVSNGGPIPRDIVREVRLQTILEAYQSMAICIHAGMRAAQNELPFELSDAEIDHFELLYRRQDALAGLPLILLRDRLVRIGIDPLTCPVEDAAPRILLRLLHYYAEMVSKRRAADRLVKSRGTVTVMSLQDFDHAAENADSVHDQLEDLAHRIVNIEDLTCSCSGGGAYGIGPTEQSEDAPLEEMVLTCAVCGWEKTVSLTDDLRSEIRDRQDE